MFRATTPETNATPSLITHKTPAIAKRDDETVARFHHWRTFDRTGRGNTSRSHPANASFTDAFIGINASPDVSLIWNEDDEEDVEDLIYGDLEDDEEEEPVDLEDLDDEFDFTDDESEPSTTEEDNEKSDNRPADDDEDE